MSIFYKRKVIPWFCYMLYRKYRPCAALQPFVECYYIWEQGQKLMDPIQVESPPNGFTAMVFVYGDRYKAENGKQQMEQVPLCFLTGQLTATYHLQLSGKIGMAGVVFKPSAISSIFRIPMPEITNQRIPLDSIFGPEVCLLTEQVADATSHFGKISAIEAYLLKKVLTQKFSLDAVDYAVDIIMERKGIISVKELTQLLNINRRQFERKFIYKVGLSPKYYCRLKRLGHVCSLLVAKKHPDWQDVVYEGGFYDQSHFIKDFVEFIQQNPSLYYKQHKELVNFLDR